MLAKARQRHREEEWEEEHLEEAFQVQLGSFLTTVEVIRGPHPLPGPRRRPSSLRRSISAAQVFPRAVETLSDT
jgi:hypothetical protein